MKKEKIQEFPELGRITFTIEKENKVTAGTQKKAERGMA